MKSHGILMTPDLIWATLAGIKTETRRIPTPRNCLFDGGTWPKELVKEGKWKMELDWASGEIDICGGKQYLFVQHPRGNNVIHRIYPRIQPGDEVWIKEAYCAFDWTDGGEEVKKRYVYRADGEDIVQLDGDGNYEENKDGSLKSPWRSPMFMPRSAARIVRHVESVGFEYLHDITEGGAESEGFKWRMVRSENFTYSPHHVSAKDAFMDTWLKIHGNTDNLIVLVYKFGKENV